VMTVEKNTSQTVRVPGPLRGSKKFRKVASCLGMRGLSVRSIDPTTWELDRPGAPHLQQGWRVVCQDYSGCVPHTTKYDSTGTKSSHAFAAAWATESSLRKMRVGRLRPQRIGRV